MKNRFFYHGTLLATDEHFINLLDIKKGSMFINKDEILTIRKVNKLGLFLIADKLNRFEDQLTIKEMEDKLSLNELKKINEKRIDIIKESVKKVRF